RAERPVEEDDRRTWELRREYRARRELAPTVKLQCDQRERRHHDLDRERQLQWPDEAGQDQQIDQAEYELGNWFAPDLTRCGFRTRTPAPSRPELASARTPSGRFLGAVGRATFPLEVHEVQQVACRPRIAQRTVVRLEFDTVKLAQLPETVRFVSGVAPTHSGDGA